MAELAVAMVLGAAWGASPEASSVESLYTPRGIGGGGAMAGYSISPFAELRLVGTDMGTVFRSLDGGKSWLAVNQHQTTYGSDLSHASGFGFSADGHTVFYAREGRSPQRSTDAGVHWDEINLGLAEKEHVLYWVADRDNPRQLYCGTDNGLLFTHDQGETWGRLRGIRGRSVGTVVLTRGKKHFVYHATESQVFRARGVGQAFEPWYAPPGTSLRAFTGGADEKGLTLALIDTQGERACGEWARGDAHTIAECGYVWVAEQDDSDLPQFLKTRQAAGRFLRLAENDSATIWATGGNWIRQYGSKVWVSRNRGATWKLKFQINDWDQSPFRPWPRAKLEYSAVGLDVGWDDNAYYSFDVNPRNSLEAGGTGNYFLHTTKDGGETWQAPFTRFADTEPREKQKKWASTGLEVTSVLRLKFHPQNPRLAYAGLSDLGGLVTEDGGDTWRITRPALNVTYDYAFDPRHVDWVYAAAGSYHDFPLNQNAPVAAQGGIFLSKDRGRSWQRLTPDNTRWNRQFLAVAFDPVKQALYGSTQGGGIARSRDGGRHWDWLEQGLPGGDKIISQIETDPVSGDVYALLTGNAPKYENHAATGIYYLDAHLPDSRWTLLRTHIDRPPGAGAVDLWRFPTAFLVDFKQPKRAELWLADMEMQGGGPVTGIWKSTDRGKHWQRSTQFTHPLALAFDSRNSRRVYASGLDALDGKWGKGGALFTNDGGENWSKNERLPFAANLDGVVPDPASPGNVFYLFFGSGMLYGPKP